MSQQWFQDEKKMTQTKRLLSGRNITILKLNLSLSSEEAATFDTADGAGGRAGSSGKGCPDSAVACVERFSMKHVTILSVASTQFMNSQ